MTINSFTGKYKFLSNFYPVGDTTTEHLYQAQKTLDEHQRTKIMRCRTPGEAKRYGRYVTLRPDWESIKIQIMTSLIADKFERGSGLSKLLLETGNQQLIEGNYWGDTFWGICNGVGENHLGKILMNQRISLGSSDL